MNKIEFRMCDKNDIEKLMKIGEDTFRETFEQQNTEEDMNNYCQESFSYEKINEEVSNKNSKYFVAEKQGKVIGYAKINFFGAQTEEGHKNSLELQRIYILKEYKGQGIGKIFLNNIIKIAKENNLEYVWLGVWEHNHKAIKFYESKGFKKFDSHIFIVGEDEQTDYLMKLEVK